MRHATTCCTGSHVRSTCFRFADGLVQRLHQRARLLSLLSSLLQCCLIEAQLCVPAVQQLQVVLKVLLQRGQLIL